MHALRRLALLVLAVSCRGPLAALTPTADSTRYRQNDSVTYRYSGSFSVDPVELHEVIESQKGNRLEILVTARRGQETLRWLQVVTDTPENQKNEKIDALYVIEGTTRTLRENKNNQDLYALYAWTLPPAATGRPWEVTQATTTETLGGRPYGCRQESGLLPTVSGPLAFQFTVCPDFLWTVGPAILKNPTTGEVVWKREVAKAVAQP